MDELARRRAAQFAHVSKAPRRPQISFKRFWRTAKTPENMTRRNKRKMTMALWKAIGKRPLGKAG